MTTKLNQVSFDPLLILDANPQMTPEQAQHDALSYRNGYLTMVRRKGLKAKGWCLRGQLRKYKSFGVEDGRVRTVYYVSVYTEEL